MPLATAGRALPLGDDVPQREVEQLGWAASSPGKCPRVLTILRSCMCRLSIAFVVYSKRRIAGGYANTGRMCAQWRRHIVAMGGSHSPVGLSANASNAAVAAASVGAR